MSSYFIFSRALLASSNRGNTFERSDSQLSFNSLASALYWLQISSSLAQIAF